MKSKLMMGVAALAFVAAANVAHADTFSFMFQGDSNPAIPFPTTTFVGTGTGTFTGNSDPFTVTSISGTLTSSYGTANITGISTFNGADNKISFLSPQVVSMSGLSFTTDGGFGQVNIRFNGTSVDLYAQSIGTNTPAAFVTSGTVTRGAAVPGPLAGAGLIPLLGFAGAWFARRRHQKLAA